MADVGFHEVLGQVERIRFAMFVTEAGGLRACPMTTQRADADGRLWFLGGAGTELVADLRDRDQVLLVYAEPGSGLYHSVHGRASVRQDAAQARVLWSKPAEVFFRGGPDDPDLRVIEVDVDRIESWQPEGTRIGQVMKVAAAALGADIEPRSMGRHDVSHPPTGGV